MTHRREPRPAGRNTLAEGLGTRTRNSAAAPPQWAKG